MNPRKLVPIAAAIAFLLSLTVSRAHAVTLFPYEYDWTSNNSGFTGKIFFDAPSNANGSLSDIDLANSFFTTPASTYYLSDSFFGNVSYRHVKLESVSDYLDEYFWRAGHHHL